MAEANGNSTILEAENLSKIFRGLHALEGYSLKLPERQILGVIGPNGAGKTTLFNVMAGNLLPTTGKVTLEGRDVTGIRSDKVAKLGMARTFQTIRLFNDLTVLENAKSARQLHYPTNLFETILSLPSFRNKEKVIEEKSLELLDLFHLSKYRDTLARNLPYGDQRRLEIVRALCTEPKVLMLDEPAAGMNPAETNELHRLILDIRDRFGLTIILVEHDMRLVMSLCERIQVLNYGKIISEGTPDEVRKMPQVIEAYLGKQRGTDA